MFTNWACGSLVKIPSPRQNLLQGPLDSMDCIVYHGDGLRIVRASCVERDHLKGVPDVVIHFGNFSEPLFGQTLLFDFVKSTLNVQESSDKAREEIRDKEQVEPWDAFPDEHSLEHRPRDGYESDCDAE
jgi:hypothetical protein